MAKHRMTPEIAREILRDCGILIDLRSSYYALPSEQAMRLRDATYKFNYRKPTNANGSKAQCFYAYIDRTLSAAEKRGE